MDLTQLKQIMEDNERLKEENKELAEKLDASEQKATDIYYEYAALREWIADCQLVKVKPPNLSIIKKKG